MDSEFNIIASTNQWRPIRLDGDDRRHVVLHTSHSNARDFEYWAPRWAAVKDPAIQKLFYRYE